METTANQSREIIKCSTATYQGRVDNQREHYIILTKHTKHQNDTTTATTPRHA